MSNRDAISRSRSRTAWMFGPTRPTGRPGHAARAGHLLGALGKRDVARPAGADGFRRAAVEARHLAQLRQDARLHVRIGPPEAAQRHLAARIARRGVLKLDQAVELFGQVVAHAQERRPGAGMGRVLLEGLGQATRARAESWARKACIPVS